MKGLHSGTAPWNYCDVRRRYSLDHDNRCSCERCWQWRYDYCAAVTLYLCLAFQPFVHAKRYCT